MKRIAILMVATIAILSLTSTACAFDVSSSHPGAGETVTLTGTSNPGQKVDFQTSFQMDLPVNSGKYEYEANGVQIPQKPNKFAVTATGVKDINVGVKIGIWISKGFNATNGVATVSHSDVPPGRYDLKVFGEALDGRGNVNLVVSAGTSVEADTAGKYSLNIDTSGVPSGAYKIQGAGETKTIQVGGVAQAPEVDLKAATGSPSVPAANGETGSGKVTASEKNATNTVPQKTTENVSVEQNVSASQPPVKEEKGFVDWLKDSLTGIFG
jgi:hypothetical protein